MACLTKHDKLLEPSCLHVKETEACFAGILSAEQGAYSWCQEGQVVIPSPFLQSLQAQLQTEVTAKVFPQGS